MIKGIHITATFEEPEDLFTDEWLEAVYTSVSRNMAILSSDMFVDAEAGTVSFHFGIDADLATSEDFIEDVARDALNKAFDDASGGQSIDEHPFINSGAVAVFA